MVGWKTPADAAGKIVGDHANDNVANGSANDTSANEEVVGDCANDSNKSGANDSVANDNGASSSAHVAVANNDIAPTTAVPTHWSRESTCAHCQGNRPCQACLQREPSRFYDIVLYNSSLQCLGTQIDPFNRQHANTYHVGWNVVCKKSMIKDTWPSEIDPTQRADCALSREETDTVLHDMMGVLVNVMGSFNRGKTWLLDQLCKVKEQDQEPGSQVALPNGMNLSTSGISAKCAKVKGQDLVLLDMAGGNTPISSCKEDEMKLALTEEQFLRQVVSKLCNNFLFVVGKMTMTDQRDLLALCKLCKSQNKKIFVVHNFMDVINEDDFAANIQEVSAILGSIDNTSATENTIERRVGTVFTHDVDGSEHRGMITKVEGSFVHVEWEEQGTVDFAYRKMYQSKSQSNHDQDQEAPGSFQVEEWQQLVHQRKINRCPVARVVWRGSHQFWSSAEQSQTNKDHKDAECRFAEEHTNSESSQEPRTIRTIRGTMAGVEQVHFFLARNPSDEELQAEKNGTKSAGAIWNRITIEHLRNTIIAAGNRTTGKGKDVGRFNYMVQINDAFAQVMTKVFRPTKEDSAVDPSKRPKAQPELMRLPHEGQLRLWANLPGGEPGKCLNFVPEGLMVANFERDGTDVQNSVRCNRYKRTQPAPNGFVVEQRMLVLEVPGYDKVDLTPCPENEDIIIEDGVLEVTLSRKSPMLSDEWIEDGHGNDIHVVENKIQKYDMEMGWSNTEITQNDGLLTILIHGNRRRLRR
jgi:hypothetical protein